MDTVDDVLYRKAPSVTVLGVPPARLFNALQARQLLTFVCSSAGFPSVGPWSWVQSGQPTTPSHRAISDAIALVMRKSFRAHLKGSNRKSDRACTISVLEMKSVGMDVDTGSDADAAREGESIVPYRCLTNHTMRLTAGIHCVGVLQRTLQIMLRTLTLVGEPV